MPVPATEQEAVVVFPWTATGKKKNKLESYSSGIFRVKSYNRVRGRMTRVYVYEWNQMFSLQFLFFFSTFSQWMIFDQEKGLFRMRKP